MSAQDKSLNVLREAIDEVRREIRSGLVTESLDSKTLNESEEKELKEFITRNIMKALKENA